MDLPQEKRRPRPLTNLGWKQMNFALELLLRSNHRIDDNISEKFGMLHFNRWKEHAIWSRRGKIFHFSPVSPIEVFVVRYDMNYDGPFYLLCNATRFGPNRLVAGIWEIWFFANLPWVLRISGESFGYLNFHSCELCEKNFQISDRCEVLRLGPPNSLRCSDLRFVIYGPNYIWYLICLGCFGPLLNFVRRWKKGRTKLPLLELLASPQLRRPPPVKKIRQIRLLSRVSLIVLLASGEKLKTAWRQSSDKCVVHHRVLCNTERIPGKNLRQCKMCTLLFVCGCHLEGTWVQNVYFLFNAI